MVVKKLLIIACVAASCLVPLTGHTAIRNGAANGDIIEIQQRPRFLFKCTYCGRVTREPFNARCPERRRGMPHAWVKFRP
jgi:hypothetical protein